MNTKPAVSRQELLRAAQASVPGSPAEPIPDQPLPQQHGEGVPIAMAADYEPSGFLVTDKESEADGDDLAWDTQSDWEAFQSKDDVIIENGSFRLAKEIPDEQNLEAAYDFSVEDGNLPVVDQSGNGYDLDTGGYSGVGRTINGVQAGDFDGTDDYLAGAVFDSTISQPNTVYAMYELDDTGERHLWDSEGSSERHVFYASSTDWNTFAGLQPLDVPNTDSGLVTATFDGSNSIVRQNGSQTASGDPGSDGMGAVSLGRRPPANGGNRYYNGTIGEVLVYNVLHDSSTISDVETYLANKWGISI